MGFLRHAWAQADTMAVTSYHNLDIGMPAFGLACLSRRTQLPASRGGHTGGWALACMSVA